MMNFAIFVLPFSTMRSTQSGRDAALEELRGRHLRGSLHSPLRVTEKLVSSLSAARLPFMVALGDAPRADHLDVVVHQRARRSGVAHFDEIGELCVNLQDVRGQL